MLTQCRVRATGYRLKELPLANVPAWQDANGADLELSIVFDHASRPAHVHHAVWNDLSRHAYLMMVPLIPSQHASILVGVPADDGVALLIKKMRGTAGTPQSRLAQYRLAS